MTKSHLTWAPLVSLRFKLARLIQLVTNYVADGEMR